VVKDGIDDEADDAPARSGDVSAGELTERVMRVAHLIRRSSMAGLAPLNLTPAQSRALRIISRAGAPMRMGELAATLGVVPRSATDLVDALQEAGLVARAVDPANRRSVLVALTQQGRDIQQAMADARAATAAQLFGTLHSADRAVLADLLGRITAGQDPDHPSHQR
jgi:DNA-binding MarR family transcriptional regulator